MSTDLCTPAQQPRPVLLVPYVQCRPYSSIRPQSNNSVSCRLSSICGICGRCLTLPRTLFHATKCCMWCRLEVRDQDLSQVSAFPKRARLLKLKINKRTSTPIIPWSRYILGQYRKKISACCYLTIQAAQGCRKLETGNYSQCKQRRKRHALGFPLCLDI
jgi:hypothetical protein